MNCRGRWEADETPDTLSREFRARWTTRGATWNAFIGKPWQVGSRKMPPDTLSREFRGRWTAGKDTWNAFAGIPWQVDGRKGHLERFCRDSVAGGRREETPGTLSRGFRARWEAEKDTWNTFAGKPWQVDGGKRHLEHFRGKTVAGGRQERTPGTLLQGFRGRWEAGSDTWNAFAGIPWQVDGRKGHLEHFRGNSVPGGQRDGTPGTLSQGFRGRWTAGRDTWNTFAGILCQVCTPSAGTYCGTPPVLPAMRAPSLLGSRCRLRPLYVPGISLSTDP